MVYSFLILSCLDLLITATSRDDFKDLDCCISSPQIESTWTRSVRNPWISEYQSHRRFQRTSYTFFQKSLLFYSTIQSVFSVRIFTQNIPVKL
jgi:hypothetical protein